MFVPRALRLKGVREKPRPKPAKAPSKAPAEGDQDDALVEAMQKTSTSSPTYQPEQIESKATKPGPRFTTKPVTPEYVGQLAAGIELIFTDYAHQEEERAKWLQDRYRTVDGEEKCTYTQHAVQFTTDMCRRHSPYCHTRTSQHFLPQARSLSSPPSTSTSRSSV